MAMQIKLLAVLSRSCMPAEWKTILMSTQRCIMYVKVCTGVVFRPTLELHSGRDGKSTHVCCISYINRQMLLLGTRSQEPDYKMRNLKCFGLLNFSLTNVLIQIKFPLISQGSWMTDFLFKLRPDLSTSWLSMRSFEARKNVMQITWCTLNVLQRQGLTPLGQSLMQLLNIFIVSRYPAVGKCFQKTTYSEVWNYYRNSTK